MSKYIGNAMSLGMLDFLDVEGKPAVLEVHLVSEAMAKLYAMKGTSEPWVSCVGHADTARLYSNILGVEVPMRRSSTSLKPGDTMLVGQYNGPRLPEGAMSLPEGATIRWMLVTVCTGPTLASATFDEVERAYNTTCW